MKDLLLLSLCCLVERQKAQYYVRGLLRVEVVWLFCRVFLAQRRWPGGGGGREAVTAGLELCKLPSHLSKYFSA